MLSCKVKQLRCLVINGAGIAVFLLTLLALLVPVWLWIKSRCPSEISTNVTITPCYYEELKGTQLRTTSRVQLPNGYFLKVVDRRGTSSLCVLHRSSTNTTFTLQLITSIEDSPLCSPEQMLDCLPSSHVSSDGTDHFGVSVWNQQSSSVHYLIVDKYSRITFQRNLTNTVFNLQDLWYNALNCKEWEHAGTVVTVILVLMVIIIVVFGILCYFFWKCHKPCRARGYETDDSRVPLLPAKSVPDAEQHEGTEEIHGPVQMSVPVEVPVDGRLQNRDRDLQRGDHLRTSSTSLVSAKSEQGHQCQSKLVGHYATSQLCPDSPPTHGQCILDSSSPSRMFRMSYGSVKSEQEQDQGVLALHTNPVCTVKWSSCSPNLTTVRSSQQQTLLQDIEDHVLLRVAAEWEPLATYLGVEPAYIDIIKKNNLLDCVGACRELFRSWINKEKGTGREHRTWDSVVQAIRKMGKEGLADELNEK